MSNQVEGFDGDKQITESKLLQHDLSSEEISLFQLKYAHETLLSGKTAAKSAFALMNTIPYDDEINLALSAYRRPTNYLWSLSYILSDNTSIYVIFTPAETIIWSSETDRETAIFHIGAIERNKAVLIDCDSHLSLVAVTSKTKITLISNVFDPEIIDYTAKDEVSTICALNHNNICIVYKHRSVSIFNAETRKFTEINYPFYERFNFFRKPLINESLVLINHKEDLIGFVNGYVTLYDNEYQPLQSIGVPSGKPISATAYDDSIFFTTENHQVFRICNYKSEKPEVSTQKLENEVDLTRISAVSPITCLVCTDWTVQVITFTEITPSLRCSDTFDNFIIGIFGGQDTLRVLTTIGGMSNLFIPDPETSIPLVELLRSILRQFIHGKQVDEILKTHDIQLSVYNELAQQITDSVNFSIKERIAVHKELFKLACRYFNDFDSSFFASNHFKMSVMQASTSTDFGELTDMIRSMKDISELFNCVAKNPHKFSSPFLAILNSAIGSVVAAGFGLIHKHNFVAETASFEAALIACLDFTDPKSDEYCGFVRIFALTQPDPQKLLISLFANRPIEAEKIAIEVHSFTSVAEMSRIDGDFKRLDRCYAKCGEICVEKLVDYYSDRDVPCVAELLEAGKFKEFRKAVIEALAFDDAALAFQYIQDDGDFAKAAQLLYDYVKENRKDLSVSQAASLLSIANLACIADSSDSIERLKRSIENRLSVLELQKIRGLGAVDIVESSDLIKHFMKLGEQGTTLSIIASTYDDRDDEENANYLVDAILLDENIGEKNMTQILEATAAAATVPQSLRAVLDRKVKDLATKTIIQNAFINANKNINC